MNRISLIISLLLVIFLSFSDSSAQEVELIFSHKFHSEDVGAECLTCHGAADTSLLSTQNLLPDMETCYECHDSESECTVCHQDPDNAIAYPRITSFVANFPHTKHIAQNIECTKCHSGVEVSESVFGSHLPNMTLCTECHSDKQKVDYCYDCHARGDNLKPDSHAFNWKKAHGISKQTTDEECQVCHTENQCLDCHQKDNLDRTVHPLNFRNNHSIFAKGNKDNCYTCHEELSFCVDCHRQELVMPRTHASAGWSNLKAGGKHARAAQLDLDSCLSCHNDSMGEPVCAQCHQGD